MALFLLVTRAGLTTNQSKFAVFQRFLATGVPAVCQIPEATTAPCPDQTPYSKRFAIRLPLLRGASRTQEPST